MLLLWQLVGRTLVCGLRIKRAIGRESYDGAAAVASILAVLNEQEHL